MIRFLGYLFLLLLIAALVLAGGYYYLDRQASAYVARSVRPIYTDWNFEAMKLRESELVRNSEFERGGRELFRIFSGALGSLKTAGPPRGGPGFGWTPDADITGIYARYSVQAMFERGEAQLHFVVVKEEGTWRIAGFRVDSPVLLDKVRKSSGKPESSPGFEHGDPEETARVTKDAMAAMACLESEAVGRCWDGASANFKRNVHKKEFVSAVEASRSSWGRLRERRLRAVEFARDLDGFPPGRYARASFDSTFTEVRNEQRLLFYDEGGVWVLVGYRWIDQR